MNASYPPTPAITHTHTHTHTITLLLSYLRQHERDRAKSPQGGVAHRLPIIALTAMSLAEDRDRAMLLGFDGFLSKPFSQDDLVAKLRGCTAVPVEVA